MVKLFGLVAIVLGALSLTAQRTEAPDAPGELDLSFNGNGIVITSFGNGAAIKAIVVQPDGRIVAAGSVCAQPGGCAFWGARENFALARYNPDGSLDNAFGAGGVVTTTVTAFDVANAVALQRDGKIVAVGTTSLDGSKAKFALVRYNPDGTLDGTFGTGGKVETSFPYGRYDDAASVAIQQDGRIIVGGTTSTDYANFQWGFGIARYNPDGTLDTSFGIGGMVITRVQGRNCEVRSIAIQLDGRVVVTGQGYGLPDIRQFTVARYNTDGSLDSTFGTNGIVTTGISTRQDESQAVALQRDGKIVVAGYSDIGPYNNYDFSLVRYNTNGTLDDTFGTGGKVTTELGSGSDFGVTLAIDPRGKIVVAGSITQCCYPHSSAVAMYNPDGTLDTSFNGSGVVITPIGHWNSTQSVVVQRDGRILAGGSSYTNTAYSDFTLMRYLGDSPATTAFDYDADGRADVSAFRPGDGAWYLLESSGGFTGVTFGNSTDKIVPADFNGDGKTDVAVYRPETGTWYWLDSSNGAFNAVQFGASEDLPTPSDYDGDGRADVSVFRPSNGTWYRLNSQDGSFYAVQFGASGDEPTIGDYDGDGKADVAVWRPSDGAWYRLNSSDGQFVAVSFGLPDDLITSADFDGDGKTDIAVYRPWEGTWYSFNSSNGALVATQFGAAEDIPTAADYDGDRRADICVFRPSDGVWYRLNSSNGSFIAVQFGVSGDRPTPAAFRY